MRGENILEQLGILLKDIKEMLRLKNLYTSNLDDPNYELFPHVNFFVIKLPLHYSALCKFYWTMIYLNGLNILMEQTWSLFTEKSAILKIRNAIFRYIHLYGIISAATLMTHRHRIIREIKKFKTLQWSLHATDPKVKAAIGRRGLIQSLIIEFCLFLSMLYAALMGKQLGRTFLISTVKSVDQSLLADFLYVFEYFNFSFCVFFAGIIPNLCIYFATQAEVQTRLLSIYVSKLARMYNSILQPNQPFYHRKVYLHLRIIFYRHLELKRFYLDNKALITSIGLKSIFPGIFSFTFNLFQYMQNDISLIICGLNTCFLILISVYTLFCGQSFEDEWKNYYREICKLPWYIWTVANRKTYLLILMGSSKTTKIKLINQVSVNYNLLVQILKYIYTSTNAACNIYKQKDAARSGIS